MGRLSPRSPQHTVSGILAASPAGTNPCSAKSRRTHSVAFDRQGTNRRNHSRIYLGFYAQTLEISGSVCIQWLMPTRSESLATIAGHWTDHPERLSRKGFLAGAPPEAILRALEPRTVPKTVVLGKVPTGFRLDRCAAAPTRQPVRAAAGTKPAAQPCSPRYSGLNH